MARLPPLSRCTEEGDFPIESTLEVQQVVVNRPLLRESLTQRVFGLMLIDILVVYSLPVLAGKHTRYLSETGELHRYKAIMQR